MVMPCRPVIPPRHISTVAELADALAGLNEHKGYVDYSDFSRKLTRTQALSEIMRRATTEDNWGDFKEPRADVVAYLITQDPGKNRGYNSITLSRVEAIAYFNYRSAGSAPATKEKVTADIESYLASRSKFLEIGDVIEDGMYAGKSGVNGGDLFVALKSAGEMNYRAAVKGAKALSKAGKHGARVPANEELHQAFNNLVRAGKLTLEDKQYWSSTTSKHKSRGLHRHDKVTENLASGEASHSARKGTAAVHYVW